MDWSDVGDWIKGNAGNGAALVGSLLTGNVSGAIAAGVSMVSGVTNTTNPTEALEKLKADPKLIIELERVKNERAEEVNRHIEAVTIAELEDKQKEHETTSKVIVEGQRVAEGWFEKNTRPLMAWCSLFFTFWYLGYSLIKELGVSEIGLIVASGGYFAWMGLRTLDKKTAAKLNKDINK